MPIFILNGLFCGSPAPKLQQKIINRINRTTIVAIIYCRVIYCCTKKSLFDTFFLSFDFTLCPNIMNVIDAIELLQNELE